MEAMMADDYIPQFKRLFDEQKAEELISIQSLDDIVSEIVSIEGGIDVIRSHHPGLSKEDILNQITSLDLLYLSLVDTLPKGVDPLTQNYNFKMNGMKFEIGKRSKYAKFKTELANFIQNQMGIIKRTFDEVLDEGASIYQYFCNRFQPEDVPTQPARDLVIQVTEITSGEKITPLLSMMDKLFSRHLYNIKAKASSERAGCLFTENGIIVMEPGIRDFRYIPYTPEGMQEVSSHMRGFRKENRKQITQATTDRVAVFKKNFTQILGNKMDKIVRELKFSELSPVEKKAFEIEREYGKKISYKKLDIERQLFYPSFSVTDLNIIEKLLSLCHEMAGLYVHEIYKQRTPRGYQSSPGNVTKMANRRLAKVYSRELGAGKTNVWSKEFDRKRYNRPKGVIALDEIDLDSLKMDFNKYLPTLIANIARETFLDFQEGLRQEYINIARPSIEGQVGLIQIYGYNIKEKIFPLSLVDFMRSSVEFHKSRFGNRPPNLTKEKIKFFERLYRLRLTY